MTYTVKAYHNTGFDAVNLPYDTALLETATNSYFNNVEVVQNRGLVNITLNATFEQVKDIDYIKIGDTYYFLVSYPQMVNDKTVRITLQEDYLLTMGGIGFINFKSCFVEYANVPDDSFGRWTKPETRWTPSQIIQVEQETLALPPDTEGLVSMSLINSTIDLVKQGNSTECNTYTDSTNPGVSVSVPAIFPSDYNTQIAFKRYDEEGLTETVLTSSPSTYIYQMGRTEKLSTGEIKDFPNQDITKGIAKTRSLGIDSCILAQYLVPGAYIDISQSIINGENLQYTKLVPVFQPVAKESLKFIQDIGDYTPHNAKVHYSNDWNRYTLFNMASGQTSSFTPESLYEPDKANISPFFIITSDLRSTGSPICFPEYLYNKLNRFMQNAIYGLNWNNAETLLYGASGQSRTYRDYAFDMADRAIGYNYDKLNNQLSFYNTLARSGTDLTFGIGGALGGMAGITGQMNDLAYQGLTQNVNNVSEYNKFALQRSQMGFGAFKQASYGALNASQALGNYQMTQQNLEAGYNLANAREADRYAWSNIVVAPTINFQKSDSIRDFFGNGFYVLRYHLSPTDAKEYDEFLDYYGYPVGEVADDISYFNNRKYFNYISCSDITITNQGYTMEEREGAKAQLTNCRLWHVLPNTWNKSKGNPLK